MSLTTPGHAAVPAPLEDAVQGPDLVPEADQDLQDVPDLAHVLDQDQHPDLSPDHLKDPFPEADHEADHEASLNKATVNLGLRFFVTFHLRSVVE